MSNFTIPVGPLHVALEEPMYFRIDVRGETIANVDIHAGHVHRGIEGVQHEPGARQAAAVPDRGRRARRGIAGRQWPATGGMDQSTFFRFACRGTDRLWQYGYCGGGLKSRCL